MMTRTDSNFNTYWNEGFQAMIADGRFKELCDIAHKTDSESEYRYLKKTVCRSVIKYHNAQSFIL